MCAQSVQYSLGQCENSHGFRRGSQRATYGSKPIRLLPLLTSGEQGCQIWGHAVTPLPNCKTTGMSTAANGKQTCSHTALFRFEAIPGLETDHIKPVLVRQWHSSAQACAFMLVPELTGHGSGVSVDCRSHSTHLQWLHGAVSSTATCSNPRRITGLLRGFRKQVATCDGEVAPCRPTSLTLKCTARNHASTACFPLTYPGAYLCAPIASAAVCWIVHSGLGYALLKESSAALLV